MNSTVSTILVAILGLVIAEIFNKLGSHIIKKYKIIERKLPLKIFFLFLFGLLFVVESLFFFIYDANRGTLTLIEGIVCIVGFCLGVFLLVVMVRLVVLMPKDTEVQPPTGGLIAQQLEFEKNHRILQAKVNKAKWLSWVSIIGGPLLTATCIYLFWAYGPQHDPPGMTAAHQQMDMLLNVLCGSSAVIGLVVFGAGLRKLSHTKSMPLKKDI